LRSLVLCSSFYKKPLASMEHIVYIGLAKLGSRGLVLWRKSTQALRSLWLKKARKLALLSTVGSLSLLFLVYHGVRKRRLRKQLLKLEQVQHNVSLGEKRTKPAVDRVFLKRLWTLLRIAMPGFTSLEFIYLLILTALLLLRTLLSIKIAEIMGTTAAGLVQQNLRKFVLVPDRTSNIFHYPMPLLYTFPFVSVCFLHFCDDSFRLGCREFGIGCGSCECCQQFTSILHQHVSNSFSQETEQIYARQIYEGTYVLQSSQC
jgi:hypothetical protein